MINITNETIQVIESSDSFKANQATLASTLHTTLADAGQEIMISLLTNRLTDNITKMTDKVSRDITFARKDVERDYYKQLKEAQKYEINYDETLLENLPEILNDSSYLGDYGLDDNDTFNKLISLFHSTQQGFVARLLLTGSEETQKFTGDSTKVFNQKLKRIENYAIQHQARFHQALKTPYDNELEIMVKNIDTFFDLYEADPELIDNKELTKYFTAHQDEYTFANALDKVRYQGLLFDDWRNYSERTEFLLELNYQQQELIHLIDTRSAQRAIQTA